MDREEGKFLSNVEEEEIVQGNFLILRIIRVFSVNA